MKKMILVALAIVIVVSALFYINTVKSVDIEEGKIGLSGEAGIVKADGTIIPLRAKPHPLAVWYVNSKEVTWEDWFYARAWITLKANGKSGQVEEIHFTVKQEVFDENGNKMVADWWVGTESTCQENPNQPWYRRRTPADAPWFTVELPEGQSVTIPIKFYDCYAYGEPNEYPVPFSEDTGQDMLRSAKCQRCGDYENFADGTYYVKITFTIHSIKWSYYHAGQKIVNTVIPQPSVYEVTFTLVKTSVGLDATLEGESVT